MEIASHLPLPVLLEPIQRFATDATPNTRPIAAGAIGAIGGSRAVEALTPMLSDDDAVRAIVVEALGPIQWTEGAAELGTMLRDRSWAVRCMTGESLRALGPAGLLILRRYLKDDDRFARDMAQQMFDRVDVHARLEKPGLSA
ncbi:MAG: HEAT repeat protein [Candidatus Poriferisodalaceae bacterium]